MRGFEGAADRNVKVFGLDRGELCELHIKLGEVGACDFLIKFLRKHVHSQGEQLRSLPERDLGKDLVAERARHDEGGVTGRAAEVDKATFREEEDVAAGRHSETVHLRFDVDDRLRIGLKPSHIDFNVKVTNAARWIFNDCGDNSTTKISHLDTIASSGITSKCLP